MKIGFYLQVGLTSLLLWGCNNIEDANPSSNNGFIKFFHGPYNYRGVEVEILPDGYVVLGNMTIRDDSSASVLIRTDKKGNQIGATQYYPGTVAKSLEVMFAGEEVLGYLILGDSIKIDPSADKVGNIEVYSIKLIQTDASGNPIKERRVTDPSLDMAKVKIDFKSSALKHGDDEILLLGTFKEDLLTPEKPFIVTFDSDLDIKWAKQYDILERNYVNSKSVHWNKGNIVWASAILKSTQGFQDSYLAVPYIRQQSTFENFSRLGEASTQYFLPRDIQPAHAAQLGYGIVGTRSETDGTKANLFFARVDAQGNFIQHSERYFDAIESSTTNVIDWNMSESHDQGESLTATRDGGYMLAGATQNSNSNRNIYLVRTDALGNMLWSKTIGGEGDELVSTIREDEDGGFVLCGTNNLSGLSSMFLIHINSVGKLMD
jgi:hypothetical protein